MQWIDRLGLFLELLAFAFAAPEVLGDRKLLALHQALNRGVRSLALVPIGIGLIAVVAAVILRVVDGESGSLRLGLESALGTLVAMAGLYFAGGRNRVARLAEHLEHDENLRRSFLIVGFACYAAGFLCQFAATFR